MITIKQTKRKLKCHSYIMEIPQSVNVYDVHKKQSHRSGKPENDNIKIKSNGDGKTKIMVAGDSVVKYLRREELSSKKNSV